MPNNVKKFFKNNKNIIKIGIILLIVIVLLIVSYKALFYSNSEKATYGVRLNNIEEHKFTNDDKKDIINKSSEIKGISTVKINVKGRLIKIFINYDENVTVEDMKKSFNDIASYFSENVKSYYDIAFYAKQNKEDEENYPLMGYKHKNNTDISFDEL